MTRGFMARTVRDAHGVVTLVWLTHEMGCRCCSTAHVAFRIRNGRSLCARCDEVSQPSETQESAHD